MQSFRGTNIRPPAVSAGLKLLDPSPPPSSGQTLGLSRASSTGRACGQGPEYLGRPGATAPRTPFNHGALAAANPLTVTVPWNISHLRAGPLHLRVTGTAPPLTQKCSENLHMRALPATAERHHYPLPATLITGGGRRLVRFSLRAKKVGGVVGVGSPEFRPFYQSRWGAMVIHFGKRREKRNTRKGMGGDE